MSHDDRPREEGRVDQLRRVGDSDALGESSALKHQKLKDEQVTDQLEPVKKMKYENI